MTLKSITLWLVVSLCIFSGCTTRSAKRVTLFENTLASQDYTKGIETVKKNTKLYGKLNRSLYWLDLGLLHHYNGEYQESIVSLQKAETILDNLYTRSVLNEAASIATNDNIRPYKAKRYEQILLHQFLAFNYLAKNEFDEALVESRKVQLVFDRFKSKDKKRNKYNDDGMSHFLSSIVYDAQNEIDDAVISLYKSASAYINGPIQIPAMVQNVAYHRFVEEERETDIKQLALASSKQKSEVVGAAKDQTEIIVIGYAGQCPILEESVFWGTYVVDGMLVLHYRGPEGDTIVSSMPAPPLPEVENESENQGKTVSGSTFHIKFAIPTLVNRQSLVNRFSLSTASLPGQNFTSTSLTDTDLLLKRDMADNQLKTVSRTALRVVLRTIAAQKAKKEMQTESGLANLLINIGTDILSDQLEKADTRLCLFFPKTIHITRIPVSPGTHTIEAEALGKDGVSLDKKIWDSISVSKGKKRFLFYPLLK